MRIRSIVTNSTLLYIVLTCSTGDDKFLNGCSTNQRTNEQAKDRNRNDKLQFLTVFSTSQYHFICLLPFLFLYIRCKHDEQFQMTDILPRETSVCSIKSCLSSLFMIHPQNVLSTSASSVRIIPKKKTSSVLRSIKFFSHFY